MEKENQQLDTDISDPMEEKRERKRLLERELKRAEEKAKKRKLIPPFVMLLAGAITSITMFVLHYRTKDKFFLILLGVLIAFFILGDVFKWMLDRFEAQIDNTRKEEIKAIEKELNDERAQIIAEAESASKVEKKKKEYEDEELLF